MKVLLLGHSGFVGRNIAHYFDEQKVDYFGVSLSNGYDLRLKESYQRLFREYRPDWVVNCAAHVGSLNYVTELAGTVISDNTRLITALYESVSEYSNKVGIINPIANCGFPGQSLTYCEADWESGPVHDSVYSYGNTRRLLVAFSRCYQMEFGLKSYNFFVPNMYGPFDSPDPNKAHALNALIAKFVKAEAESKGGVDIWGTGIAVREWLFARDFSKIVYSTITGMSKSQGNINIAQNTGLSIKQLAELICQKFDVDIELLFDPSRPDGAPRKVMDDTNFRLDFQNFQFEDFSSGIDKTLDYYRSIYPF